MSEDWAAKIKLLTYYREITMDRFDKLEEAIRNDMEPDTALSYLAEIRYEQYKLRSFIEKVINDPAIYGSALYEAGKKFVE
jgi:hypothetical protein